MPEYAEIDFDNCVHITGAAALLDTGDEQVWVPLSLIGNGNELDVGKGGVAHVMEWFAAQNGLV